MTPDEFLRSIEKREPLPAYLFLGPEGWSRDRCRRALVERMLPEEDREQGVTRHDLSVEDLSAVIDDARSFSLFASRRVIWAGLSNRR
jgi:DNA polymerase III subunit delta